MRFCTSYARKSTGIVRLTGNMNLNKRRPSYLSRAPFAVWIPKSVNDTFFSRIFNRTRVHLRTAIQKHVFCAWWSWSRIQRVTCCLQGQNSYVLRL